MKNILKKVTALVLTLTLLASLCCVNVFAADLTYAHLEIGKFETGSLKAGDTVRIPLNLVGMKAGQYCGGLSANITLGAGLEWFETNAECADWTSLVSSFGSKFINHNTGLLNAIDFGASSAGKSSCNANGKLCDILCRVTADYDGTNATIALSGVSISGTTAAEFLNSTDGTKKEVDNSAIIFDGKKVQADEPVSPVVIPAYTIVAEADKTEAIVGNEITVTVTVKGGEYVGAAVKLSYDSDKFEIKTAAAGWDETSTGYAYYNVNQNGNTFAENTVIGTFVFTVKALDAEANAVVTLSNSYVAQNFDDGWSNEPANNVPAENATVTIKQGTLDVSAPTMDDITYDGNEHAFEAVTSDPADATITYSETEDGTYTSNIPSKTNVGTYTLYYRVEKAGYTTVSGSYTMKIVPAAITGYTITANDDVNYDEQSHESAKVTVAADATQDVTITYTWTENGENKTSTTVPSFIDIGEYTVSYTISKDNYTSVTDSYTFNIISGVVEASASDVEVTYDGLPHSITVTVTKPQGATITYSTDGVNYSETNPTFTDVTEGAVTVYWKVSKNGYTDKTGTNTVKINAATIAGYTVNWNDITAYNGTEQAVATVTQNVGATAGVTTTWKVNDGTETNSIPTIKNAGTYTVTYTISKTGYTTITETKTFTVAKAKVTITADDKTMTYGDTVPELTKVVTGTIYTGDDLNIQLSTTATSTSNVDDYDITISYDTTNTNYDVTANKGTLTINAATITGYSITANADVNYDEQPHVSATVTTGTPADATITYKWTEGGVEKTSTTVPSFTEGGTYTVSYTISKANYTDVTGSYTFTINSGVVEATASDVEVTYDGQPHSITVTVTKPEGTTISYRTSEDDEWSTTNPTFTNVTETPATVYWKVSKNGYNDKTGTNTVTINAATITGYSITANETVKYDESAHVSATVVEGTPADATITYKWTDNGEQTSTTVPSFTKVGTYTVSYTISKANYTDVTGSYTFTIENGVIEATASDVEATYDGQSHSITVNVTTPTGATVTYSTDGQTYSTTNPTFTNVTEGAVTVYWKVSKNGYTDKTGSNTVTINPKAVTITVNNKTITLGDALPTFDGSVDGLVESTGLGTVTYTCPTYTNAAGTYDIIANYTENSNYTVTVHKGTLTINAPAFEVEIINEYVSGYHMILVYTNTSCTFSYDGGSMYDVTSAGYKYNGTEYSKVYAIVVKGAEGDTAESLRAKVGADMTPVAAALNCATLDVNGSNSVDLNDAVAVVAVYNAKSTYMNGHMPIVLKADVNNDKVVNAADFGIIKAEYMK